MLYKSYNLRWIFFTGRSRYARSTMISRRYLFNCIHGLTPRFRGNVSCASGTPPNTTRRTRSALIPSNSLLLSEYYRSTEYIAGTDINHFDAGAFRFSAAATIPVPEPRLSTEYPLQSSGRPCLNASCPAVTISEAVIMTQHQLLRALGLSFRVWSGRTTQLKSYTVHFLVHRILALRRL